MTPIYNPVWEFMQAMMALAATGKIGKEILHKNVDLLAKQAGKSPEEIRKTIQDFSSKKDAWREALGKIEDERVKQAIMYEIYSQAYLDGILTKEELTYAEEIRNVLSLSVEKTKEIETMVKRGTIEIGRE